MEPDETLEMAVVADCVLVEESPALDTAVAELVEAVLAAGDGEAEIPAVVEPETVPVEAAMVFDVAEPELTPPDDPAAELEGAPAPEFAEIEVVTVVSAAD